MKAELKEIERLTIKNNGYASFDTWGNDTRSMLYFFLINEFKEKYINSFEGENGSYLVYYRSGHNGRGGMDMGTPDSMVVEKIKKCPLVL